MTDEQVATLRAQLTGNPEDHKLRLHQLGPAARNDYPTLVSAAFCLAVERRFTKDSTDADVVEFVSNVRARSEQLAEAVDPSAAERVIQAVLGHDSAADLDNRTKAQLYAVLLVGLIGDEQLDDAGLDKFMTQARELAEEFDRLSPPAGA